MSVPVIYNLFVSVYIVASLLLCRGRGDRVRSEPSSRIKRKSFVSSFDSFVEVQYPRVYDSLIRDLLFRLSFTERLECNRGKKKKIEIVSTETLLVAIGIVSEKLRKKVELK